MPRSAAEMVRGLGFAALDVRDIGLGGAEDSRIAAYAQAHGLALITRDFDFSDIRNYPPASYAGIIVLRLPDDAVASQVVEVLRSFLCQSQLLPRLPGRLAVVDAQRVRFRPGLS